MSDPMARRRPVTLTHAGRSADRDQAAARSRAWAADKLASRRRRDLVAASLWAESVTLAALEARQAYYSVGAGSVADQDPRWHRLGEDVDGLGVLSGAERQALEQLRELADQQLRWWVYAEGLVPA